MYKSKDVGANNNFVDKNLKQPFFQNDNASHNHKNAETTPGEELCCCEYVNSHGQRSHLMALFCDCAELDDAFDRLFKGASIPSTRSNEIMNTIEDR